MTRRPKPTLPTLAAFAAIHANTQMGSDAICYLAEAVAPGFTAACEERIFLRSQGRWEEDLIAKRKCLRAFRPKRYFLFMHVLLLIIGCRIVTAHDRFFLSKGDQYRI